METKSSKTTGSAAEAHAEPKRSRLFGDVSIIQVTATALASVTSVLLASSIGIAGSIIGVAVASVVSTLAASLYKKFLADSAEKIKEIPVIARSGKTLANVVAVEHGEGDVRHAEPAPSQGPEEHSDEDREAGDESTSAERVQKQRKIIFGLIVVCVLSALAAVAVSAAVITVATTGEGLGHKPDPITFVRDDGGAKSEQPSQDAESEPATNGNAANVNAQNAANGTANQTTNGTNTVNGTGNEEASTNTSVNEEASNGEGAGGSGNSEDQGTSQNASFPKSAANANH